MIKTALVRVKLCLTPTPTGIAIHHDENNDTLTRLGEHLYSLITSEVLDDYDNGDVTETELLETAAAFETMARDMRNHVRAGRPDTKYRED